MCFAVLVLRASPLQRLLPLLLTSARKRPRRAKKALTTHFSLRGVAFLQHHRSRTLCRRAWRHAVVATARDEPIGAGHLGGGGQR
jgi:hypothetical protein